ncbi:MAG TPA: hypothetical protein PKM48_00340 [Parvularculaceae bacterium]|nr:hypothetical protein [Parvularculaceae bacterium]HNS85492.1 hypothetical protein [Parvularculaceae bacterium]
MISTARASTIIHRLARNLIVTLAVTAIFAFKAVEPQVAAPALELFADASR